MFLTQDIFLNGSKEQQIAAQKVATEFGIPIIIQPKGKTVGWRMGPLPKGYSQERLMDLVKQKTNAVE